MNPFYEAGTFCTGPACEACKECNRNYCDRCNNTGCACPEPVLDIDRVAGTQATYRFNINGKTVTKNFQPGIIDGQTDTSLIIDIVDRLLKFSAERHTDSISAAELGSILHLNDLGDVSTKGAENGAMMVYKKNDNCGNGCFGVNNAWEPWNALDEQKSTMAYAAGFDADGIPVTLQQPANPNQYYNLSWNGPKQLSYGQVTEASAQRLDSEGFAYQVYVDPNTKEQYYIKVKP